MTARQIFESLLVELSKVNAPSMLLQDFNYFMNKAVYQYINKRYNTYDVNQQTTDDLRVLKATTQLTPHKVTDYGTTYNTGLANLFGATFHMLNCICVYELQKNHKCYDKGNYVQFPAKRLTADTWSIIVNDYYNRPLPERPYYYIHNTNNSETQTNPVKPDGTGTDMVGTYKVDATEDTSMPAGNPQKVSDNQETGTNFNRIVTIGDTTFSTVEKEAAQRYGNPSKVRCEIRYGKDSSVFSLSTVFIDYIKTPQYIRLTQEQVDLTEDTSQIMEFPDYICQEIINELVHLVMENTADPRLQSHIPVTQSIATPAQQQVQQPQPRQQG